MSESVPATSDPKDEPARWVSIPVALPPEGQSQVFEVEGRGLLLCHAEGQAYVIQDECPHVQVSLAGGAIRGTVIECPLHGGQMDLRDGSPVAMPIRRPGVCFPVRETETGFEVGLD